MYVIDRAPTDSKLRPMSHRRLTIVAAGLALAGACSSGDSDAGRAQRTEAPPDSARVVVSQWWFDGALPLVLVPAHSNDRALVIQADSSAADPEERTLDLATLFRLDGSSVPVRAVVTAGSEGCIDAALEPPPDRGWGAGFAGGAFTAIKVDSLRAIARRDSIRLSATVFRLASTVPNSAGGRFSGLPFSLVDMWRIRLPGGRSAIVAATRRQINQEDSPLEERTLIIAELDSSAANPPRLVYSSRSTAAEETVEGSDLLAVVATAGGGLYLLIRHDFGGQASYSVIERSSPGEWRRRWTSPRLSC
jgi:hypothetical protein